jgi:hypothetical protein
LKSRYACSAYVDTSNAVFLPDTTEVLVINSDAGVLVGGSGADTFFRYAGEFDLFVDFSTTQGDRFRDLL